MTDRSAFGLVVFYVLVFLAGAILFTIPALSNEVHLLARAGSGLVAVLSALCATIFAATLVRDARKAKRD